MLSATPKKDRPEASPQQTTTSSDTPQRIMKGRVAMHGGGHKPIQHKLHSETFALKAVVLSFYDTHTMSRVIDTFWPGIDPKSTAYKSKVRVIRRWKQQRAHIMAMTSKTRTAQQKRSHQVGAAKTLSDDAEMDILDWIVALCSHGVPVSVKMLELEALSIAELYDIPRSAFAASHTWMASYLARYSLSLRAKTRQGQVSAADSVEVAREFTATVRRRVVDEGIAKIYNADQTAIFFEYVPKHTIDQRGANTVWIKCGGKSKERLTVMLVADSTGHKYDPWVIVKMRPSKNGDTREENTRLRHGFSRGMWPEMEKLQLETHTEIYANGKGWWNAELSLKFLEHFFGDQCATDDPVMLIWDDFSAHWTDEIVAFAAKTNVVLQRVPPGYTHCCQPADIAWNKPMKDGMRGSWTEYLKEECAKVLVRRDEKEPKLTVPDRVRVLRWLHAAWSGRSRTTVKGGFKHIDLMFDGRDNTPSKPVEPNEVDDSLVDALRTLSWLDTDVGQVCWDDDIVERENKWPSICLYLCIEA